MSLVQLFNVFSLLHVLASASVGTLEEGALFTKIPLVANDSCMLKPLRISMPRSSKSKRPGFSVNYQSEICPPQASDKKKFTKPEGVQLTSTFQVFLPF